MTINFRKPRPQDMFRMFVEDVLEPGGRMHSKDIYKLYLEYMDLLGHPPDTRIGLTRVLGTYFRRTRTNKERFFICKVKDGVVKNDF